MTQSEAPRGIDPGRLQAAEADLANVRRTVLSAARGDADATELKDSVRNYLDQHGPVLRAAAAAVGEEVRRQLLDHLYRWRRQLDEQLGDRRTIVLEETSPGDRPADAGAERHN